MPPKVEFEQIDEHGSMVHSVISYSLSLHGKGCCDPSTIGDYTLSFNRLYFLSCTVIGEKTKQGFVKKYIRDSVKEYSHTPDAVFALEKDGNAALFFLEIDRGVEVVGDPEKGLLKAIVFYLNYWTTQKWQRYQKDFHREFKTFRLLVVTTSKDRLQHVREAVTQLPFTPSHAKRFLWGTIQSEATHEWIFESIWRSLDDSDHNLYRIG